MKSILKNSLFLKRILLLNILLFSTLAANAGFGSKLKNTLSKEFNSLTGVYIMGGIIIAGLLIYLITNFVFKEKPEPEEDPHISQQHSIHNHMRHKQRHAQKSHKKTS